MKVAFFCYNLSRLSGAAKQAKSLSEALKKFGVTVELMSLERKGSEEAIPSNKLFQIIWLLKFFMASRPDIVHCHGFMWHIVVLAKVFRVPVVLKSTLMGDDDFGSLLSQKSLVRRLAARWAISCVNVNNALSVEMSKVNRQYFGGDVVVIPNGYLGKYYSGGGKSSDLVFLGAVVPRKMVLEAVDFFESKLTSLFDRFLIVGPVYPQSTEFCQMYSEAVVKRVALSPKVLLLGEVDSEKARIILSGVEGIMLLSDREGMPNVVVEGLANGCFVVAGTAALPYISEGTGAHYLDDKLPEKFRSWRADASANYAKSNYCIEKVAKDHFELYANILNEN